MTRLAGLILLGLLAVPVEASNPSRIKMERPKPVETAEPPLAKPIPVAQPAAEPVRDSRALEAIVWPGRVIVRLVAERVDRYRMSRLLNESEGIPPGVTYERLYENIGP